MTGRYVEAMKRAGLNNRYGIELASAIIREFKQGIDGGFVSSEYLREKVDKLRRFCDDIDRWERVLQDEEGDGDES